MERLHKKSPRSRHVTKQLSWYCNSPVRAIDLDSLQHERSAANPSNVSQVLDLSQDSHSNAPSMDLLETEYVSEKCDYLLDESVRLLDIDLLHCPNDSTEISAVNNAAARYSFDTAHRSLSHTLTASAHVIPSSSGLMVTTMTGDDVDRVSPMAPRRKSRLSQWFSPRRNTLMGISNESNVPKKDSRASRQNYAQHEMRMKLKHEKKRERERRQKLKNDANYSIGPNTLSSGNERSIRSHAKRGSRVGRSRIDSEADPDTREITFGEFITAMPSGRLPFHDEGAHVSSYYALESSIMTKERETRYAEEQRFAERRLSCTLCGRSAAKQALAQRKKCLPLCFTPPRHDCSHCSAALDLFRESTLPPSDSSVSTS